MMALVLSPSTSLFLVLPLLSAITMPSAEAVARSYLTSTLPFFEDGALILSLHSPLGDRDFKMCHFTKHRASSGIFFE